jgi:hypothetical protein
MVVDVNQELDELVVVLIAYVSDVFGQNSPPATSLDC